VAFPRINLLVSYANCIRSALAFPLVRVGSKRTLVGLACVASGFLNGACGGSGSSGGSPSSGAAGSIGGMAGMGPTGTAGSASGGSTGGASGTIDAAGGADADRLGTAGMDGGAVSGSGGTTGSASGGATGNGGGAGGATAGVSWCLPISAQPMAIDWGKAVVDSRIRADPGLGWAYPDALFLHGAYLAYKRLGDPTYFAYIKRWADAHVGGAAPYDSLDSMQPTLVLEDMYRETHNATYGTAPKAVATRLENGSYPTTSDGGFWHNVTLKGQLWGDGVFMELPPLVNYGELFADAGTVDIATKQLLVYDDHLAAPNDLHIHQWDESTKMQSCCEWCRAEGWYEMSSLMILDQTPPTHPNYAALVTVVQRLAKGLAATQDPATGRWWQVMDRPRDPGNWLETSCTAMHTYFLSKASQRGYIEAATYAPIAIKGFRGEMQEVSNPTSPQIHDICPGTGVGTTPNFYYQRPKATNDNHGIGSFLIMYDQLVCR